MYYDERKKNMIKYIKQLSQKHSTWEVFSDFLTLAAMSIANSCCYDKVQWQKNEDLYMKTIKRYTHDEAQIFPKILSEMVMALESKHGDVLGEIFMELELGNKWHGQFFTPYNISLMMAKLGVGNVKELIKDKGYFTVAEPCIGGGANIIATAQAVLEQECNFQQCMVVQGVDIDIKAVYMSYIQLSVLGIPAVILHGDSLRMEIWGEYKTPFYVLGHWDSRLYGATETKKVSPHARLLSIVDAAKQKTDNLYYAL